LKLKEEENIDLTCWLIIYLKKSCMSSSIYV